MKIPSTNPAKNFAHLGDVSSTTPDEVRQIVLRAREAFSSWRALDVSKRVIHLERLYTALVAAEPEINLLTTREMGKPLAQSKSSFIWAMNHFRWSLENAVACLSPVTTFQDSAELHQEVREPFGVVAVICPWNFPISNFISGVIQPLLAGNTVVYKISEEVPLFGHLIEETIQKAGLPSGVFQEVYGAGDVGEVLSRSDINFISFTGSSAVGRKLYKIAAEKFIPCVLELGGSDCGIVFADAAIDDHIPNLFWAKFINNGQICCGLKRLIVERSIQTAVVEKLKKFIAAQKVGDPEDEGTIFGSLAARRQADLLAAQVGDAQDKGATVIRCGEIHERLSGAYYPPTLLLDVTPSMRAWHEELFGPVLTVIPFDTESEAIQLANATEYGLSGYVFTSNNDTFSRVAAAVETGSICLNGCDFSKPFNAFGGFKMSGMGKTAGTTGFKSCSRVKVVSRRMYS